jgi:hypothetical protein
VIRGAEIHPDWCQNPAVEDIRPVSCANVPDILVRNIEEVVADRIKAIARERELSINEVILHVLKQGLGFGGEDIFRREMHDIAVLGGTWDPSEAAVFRSAVEAFEQVEGQPLFEDSEGKEPEQPQKSDQPQPDEPPK